MKKLAGGNLLDCGHHQVISYTRQRIAAAGYEQTPVWCIDCNQWVRLAPKEVESILDNAP